ncbi:hypothetical protein CY0110_19872 [Crocosphaera chwakensis CCY0110]|uniref:Uncharacterized protein n=1 Tax=Crocosphaera chwakensis CCY0110 TaxID=391612 RepID=A3IJV6_9CHRO|nr:hypothetical protein CY0110_19872 [Crocosphaera chwakensis CCY0110]
MVTKKFLILLFLKKRLSGVTNLLL